MPALPRNDPLGLPLGLHLAESLPPSLIIPATSRDIDYPTHVRRQAPDSTSDTVIIPTTYHGQSSSPSPGVVVGIVLGSVAGFLFLLLILYAILGCGFSFGPAVYSTRRRRGSEVEVTVMEEVDESSVSVRRAPRRSRDRDGRRSRRRSGRHSGGTYAVRTRESVDIVDGDDVRRAIPVPAPMSPPPPPPQQQPRRSRSVVESEDEVVVIEEHEGPRRKKKGRRRSGGDGSRERRRSRRQSELSEVDMREVRRSVSRRRYSGDD